MRLTQAVVWSEGGGGVRTGRLDLDDHVLSLSGSGADGRLTALRLRYEDLAGVRIGRSAEERVQGSYALVVERNEGPDLRVAAVGRAGALIEAGDLIASLIAERAAASERVAVVLPIRSGTRERALELVREGPPFDLEASPFTQHHVFVTDREVIFVFGGESVRRAAERLVRDPAVWKAAASWRDCLAGRPRIADQEYGWSRSSNGAAAAHDG